MKRIKSARPLENVSDFSTAHPEFALWRTGGSDPGTVKFNHAKHLALPAQTGLRGIDVPLSQLKEQQCGYCHRTDPAGRYMLRIKYQSHCQSCHPLQIRISDNWRDPALAKAAQAFAGKPVPHPAAGQGPATVRALLRDRFLDFAQANPRATGAVDPEATLPRPLPGMRRGEPATRPQLLWSERQLQDAERLLFDGADGCRRCHHEHKPRLHGLPNYGKPEIPARWFKSSRFSHRSHVMLRCVACHEQAQTSTQTKDILMPKIADCRTCHDREGGARTGCFECHEFHKGAETHWRGDLTIEDVRK
jgi:hypothetical protein